MSKNLVFPSRQDNALPGRTLVAFVFFGVLAVVSIWTIYTSFRIDVGSGEIAILIRKTGMDLKNGEEIAPTADYKGVQRAVLTEGRYFYNPYSWSWQVIAQQEIEPGKMGVKISLTAIDSRKFPMLVGVSERDFFSEKMAQRSRHAFQNGGQIDSFRKGHLRVDDLFCAVGELHFSLFFCRKQFVKRSRSHDLDAFVFVKREVVGIAGYQKTGFCSDSSFQKSVVGFVFDDAQSLFRFYKKGLFFQVFHQSKDAFPQIWMLFQQPGIIADFDDFAKSCLRKANLESPGQHHFIHDFSRKTKLPDDRRNEHVGVNDYARIHVGLR